MKWETKEHRLEWPVDVAVKTGEGENAATETVHVEKVVLSAPKGKKMREIMRLINKMEADPGYSEGEMTMDSIQIISDMPPGAIDELHPRDITTMGDITAPFLEAVMGGGGSSATSPSGTAKTKQK